MNTSELIDLEFDRYEFLDEKKPEQAYFRLNKFIVPQAIAMQQAIDTQLMEHRKELEQLESMQYAGLDDTEDPIEIWRKMFMRQVEVNIVQETVLRLQGMSAAATIRLQKAERARDELKRELRIGEEE